MPTVSYVGGNIFSRTTGRGKAPGANASKSEDGMMDGLWSAQMWGTPVGLGLFFFLMGIGMGVFFWGVSKLPPKK
jgi:hypothetical protein